MPLNSGIVCYAAKANEYRSNRGVSAFQPWLHFLRQGERKIFLWIATIAHYGLYVG